MVMTKKKASFCLVRCKTQPQQRSRVVLLLSGAVRLLSKCECFVFCNNKSWRHTHTHTHDRTQEGEGGGLASSPPTKSTNKKQKAHIYKGSSCCQQSCLSVCLSVKRHIKIFVRVGGSEHVTGRARHTRIFRRGGGLVCECARPCPSRARPSLVRAKECRERISFPHASFRRLKTPDGERAQPFPSKG